MKLTGINGAAYSLDPTPIGSGGEGEIYRMHGTGAFIAGVRKIDRNQSTWRALHRRLCLLRQRLQRRGAHSSLRMLPVG